MHLSIIGWFVNFLVSNTFIQVGEYFLFIKTISKRKCFIVRYHVKQSTNIPVNRPIKLRPRPWYMSNGIVFPKPANFSKELGRRDAKLLPEEDPNSDRFENQLMFVPPNYYETRKGKKNKTILLYNGWGGLETVMKNWFSNAKCPVDSCTFSLNQSDTETADFVMFSGQHEEVKVKRTPNQIYAFYRLESPITWPQKFPSTFTNNK